jgi:hypothetical protein
MVIGERSAEVPFRAHVELLQLFLDHREEIVEKIQGLLNAQSKPGEYLRDDRLLSRLFEDCFFTLTAITHNSSHLRGQLQQAHWAGGFRPRDMPELHNDLIDPAQMMIRGFHLWRQTRWPGRNGRVRYAHTLFNLYLIRCLELLIMRVWDAGTDPAGARLTQVQGLLDELWKGSPADQPVLARDARWLIPLAQSPTTDELAPYFAVLEQIAESLAEEDRIEIHKASVQMAGGHLRSQLRHYCIKERVSLDEKRLVLTTRNSNALDFAVLIQGLVPLLRAYERAWRSGDRHNRLELAGTIFQGISVDPELFVNRIDLLGSYTMIEHVFVTAERGQVAYTQLGLRHVQLLQEYPGLISRLSRPLLEDCPHFRPVPGAYSPYAVIYGFSSNITEHMALKALQPDPVTQFSLEDVFTEGAANTGKLAWVSGWRKLPHIKEEVLRMFDYPQQFAEDIFKRIDHAWRRRVSDDKDGVQSGRIFIPRGEALDTDSKAPLPADLPLQYIGSSDARLVAAHKAHYYEQMQLLRDRQEGMFLVSYRTSDGWVAITKDVLTEVLGMGNDVKIVGLSSPAEAVLRLMCPNLIVPTDSAASDSPRTE